MKNSKVVIKQNHNTVGYFHLYNKRGTVVKTMEDVGIVEVEFDGIVYPLRVEYVYEVNEEYFLHGDVVEFKDGMVMGNGELLNGSGRYLGSAVLAAKCNMYIEAIQAGKRIVVVMCERDNLTKIN